MGQRPTNRNRRHSPKRWPLTVKQVAAEERVSVYIVRDWLRNGLLHRKLPGARGHITLRIKDVHKWRAENGRLESSSRPELADGEPPVDDDAEVDENDDSTLGVRFLRAKIAKEKELIEKHRIANERSRGLLLDAADVERRWLERCQLVGSSLVAFAQRVAPLLVGKKLRAIQKVLDTATRDLLSEFSREWPE